MFPQRGHRPGGDQREVYVWHRSRELSGCQMSWWPFSIFPGLWPLLTEADDPRDVSLGNCHRNTHSQFIQLILLHFKSNVSKTSLGKDIWVSPLRLCAQMCVLYPGIKSKVYSKLTNQTFFLTDMPPPWQDYNQNSPCGKPISSALFSRDSWGQCERERSRCQQLGENSGHWTYQVLPKTRALYACI